VIIVIITAYWTLLDYKTIVIDLLKALFTLDANMASSEYKYYKIRILFKTLTVYNI